MVIWTEGRAGLVFFILILYTMLYTVSRLLTMAVTSPNGPETRGASVGEETEVKPSSIAVEM